MKKLKFKIGDRVLCKILKNGDVNWQSSFKFCRSTDIREVLIIGVSEDHQEYMIDPLSIKGISKDFVENCWTIESSHIKNDGVGKKYKGKPAWMVSSNAISEIVVAQKPFCDQCSLYDTQLADRLSA